MRLNLGPTLSRLRMPAVPFAASAVLSLSTVGNTVHWQDSGLFLSGVKDLAVLHPPGFVLYLVLCRAWTAALGFLDFTLAVHLFSSFCAASAASSIALAARELLRRRDPSPSDDLAAIAAGCLAAAGFSFASAAILAKGYALFTLVLSLLLWRLIRADATRSGRDFTQVAALIGLAWAAHPSAALLAPALVLFAAAHRKTLGWKGVAGRTALAAACALGPSLLLPVLAARLEPASFGHPSSPGDWFRYVRGGRFTDLPGAFGWETFRAIHTLQFAWEEFLGVGTAFVALGLARIAAADRRLLLAIACWTAPSAAVTTLFRIEGQQDLWLVASWLPLHLAAAVGLRSIPPRFSTAGILLAGTAGLAWAATANLPDLSLRSYDLAERFGRFHLEQVEKDAILVLESDDALGTTQYLQGVRGLRSDVLIVSATRFDASRWYERALRRRDPGLEPGEAAGLAAFVRANAPRRRVYFESPPSGFEAAPFVPAGPLVRLLRPGEADAPIPWTIPPPGDVRPRRNRGIRLEARAGGFSVAPEPYERRWAAALARARLREGLFHFRKGGPDHSARAAETLEAALALDPDPAGSQAVLPLAVTYAALGRPDRAEPLFRRALAQDLAPRNRVHALSALSRLCAAQGRAEEARAFRDQAMAVVGSDPDLRREFERFSGGRP